MAEIICDGIHIHPSVVRATFQMMGADRMILISDSMRATGMPDGQYTPVSYTHLARKIQKFLSQLHGTAGKGTSGSFLHGILSAYLPLRAPPYQE